MIAIAACSTDDGELLPELEPAPFPSPTGSSGSGAGGTGSPTTSGAATYPRGPYGTDVGDVIDAHALRVLPATGGTTFYDVDLSAFFNPTGSEAYPATPPLEGAKPRALVIQLCAEVGPCLNDWADELPAMYATYSEVGLDILQVGIFSLDGGPVTEPELLETRESFSVTWHLALEPEPSLSGAVGPQGIPAYLVVDTSSMAITYYAEEGADGALFEAVEAVLFSNP